MSGVGGTVGSGGAPGFAWDDFTHQLTIGARTGGYTGMLASRTFNMVWVSPNHGNGVAVTGAADQVVKYDGAQVVASAM